MNKIVLFAFLASVGTWLLTALGAAAVFFFKKPNDKVMNFMLGFASGVMIAASFWSLLDPAISGAEENLNIPAYLVVSIGFVFGAIFVWFTDKLVAIARKNTVINEKTNRIFMLILSITIHNIPEGFAVGVAFGALGKNYTANELLSAFTIAIGIGLQNFPEGTAVSVPLRREGYTRFKSFMLGQASAVVEPISALIGALLVVYIKCVLPFALSFAAGAMIIVAVHELIPECQKDRSRQPYFATMGIILGFTAMMVLDVMLG